MLEAFITNLGRYNEGYLDGAYLKLPAEKEDVQALLKKIHVDGVRYEEIFITDYETDVPGLYDCLGEYESIDELNHLAHALQEVEDQHDMDKFAAAVELGELNRQHQRPYQSGAKSGLLLLLPGHQGRGRFGPVFRGGAGRSGHSR